MATSLLVPRSRASALNPVALASGGAVVALGLAATAIEAPPICPFRLVTGHGCPLCGCTRAAFVLLQGDVGEAWAMHPYVFALIAQAVVLALIWAVGRQLSTTSRNAMYWANIIGVVALWALRWATGSLGIVVA